jgi:hypothetical protein
MSLDNLDSMGAPVSDDIDLTGMSEEGRMAMLEYVELMAERKQGKIKTSERTFELKKLRDLNKEIIRLAVTGMKQKEIAKVVGCTEMTVANTLASGVARQQLENMRAARDVQAIDIGARIQELAAEAIEVMGELLMSPSTRDNVRKDIAVDLLDRAGHSPVRRLETRQTITQSELDEVKKRALEVGRMSGLVRDADFVTVDS